MFPIAVYPMLQTVFGVTREEKRGVYIIGSEQFCACHSVCFHSAALLPRKSDIFKALILFTTIVRGTP